MEIGCAESQVFLFVPVFVEADTEATICISIQIKVDKVGK